MKNAGSKEMTPRRIVAATALLATLAGCQAQNENPVPDHLLGVWTTSAPRYADRYIEIRHDMIIFGTGVTHSSSTCSRTLKRRVEETPCCTRSPT